MIAVFIEISSELPNAPLAIGELKTALSSSVLVTP
jgi:hypothetical protein